MATKTKRRKSKASRKAGSKSKQHAHTVLDHHGMIRGKHPGKDAHDAAAQLRKLGYSGHGLFVLAKGSKTRGVHV